MFRFFKKVLPLFLAFLLIISATSIWAHAADDIGFDPRPGFPGELVGFKDLVFEDVALFFLNGKNLSTSEYNEAWWSIIDHLEAKAFYIHDRFAFISDFIYFEYPEIAYDMTIGKYTFTLCKDTDIYVANGFYVKTLKEAWEEGEISDEELDDYAEAFKDFQKKPVRSDNEIFNNIAEYFLADSGYENYANAFEVIISTLEKDAQLRNGIYIFKNRFPYMAYTCDIGYEQIGKYYFWHSSGMLNWYVATEDYIMLLRDAYNEGHVDLADFSDVFYSYWLLGDSDNDDELTINDATELQKILANPNAVIYNEEEVYFDYNQDGDININDVTDIQKELAHLVNLWPDKLDFILED